MKIHEPDCEEMKEELEDICHWGNRLSRAATARRRAALRTVALGRWHAPREVMGMAGKGPPLLGERTMYKNVTIRRRLLPPLLINHPHLPVTVRLTATESAWHVCVRECHAVSSAWPKEFENYDDPIRFTRHLFLQNVETRKQPTPSVTVTQ